MSSPSKKVIIITAPSGSGKTSITRHLLNKFQNQLAFSISAATRQKRELEKDGRDYYFISVEDFKNKINRDEFIEWEMVYEGKYYGTLKSEIYRIWENSMTPLLDVDVQGAIHIRQQFFENSLTIFIEPPSIDELKKRLMTRGTENPQSLAARINKAAFELSFKDQFDKIIINDELDKACKKAEEFVKEFLQINQQ